MYTYLIGWSDKNIFYYGVRYAKKSDPNELWKTYFTSSKYVKSFREKNGDPDIIQIRKTFNDKKAAILWEHKVLKRLNVVKDEKWLNKTDNFAIDYTSSKRNTIPGMLASKKKIKGKTYEELYGLEKAAFLKERSKGIMEENWNNQETRLKMSKKPSDTSKYKEAALKRWANKEQREKLCASMRGVSKKSKEV
jgi:hypothetical protein